MYSDDEIEEEAEEHEPQVTSLDPNERKLARRLRIERRSENVKKQAQSLMSGKIEEEEVKGDIQVQVDKSTIVLRKLNREGAEYITNASVANDAREVDRRDSEGVGRQKIIEQLEEEADEAQTIFEEIAEKWAEIGTYKDPLLINEEILGQKEKCDMLISHKDGIIAILRDDIKMAERKFTKDQRKQMEDIDLLAQRIEKQVTFMRRAYTKEFDLIEGVILMERKKLIDSNNKRWEELYKKREQLEIQNSDNKFEQLEEFDEKMNDMRIEFEEKFRATNISLENDIDSVQRELERIKALALLNSEKLDYNYQILKKREDENIIIKSQQKRRMNKLQDVINNLRKKIRDYESTTNNLIKKLNEDTKKMQTDILSVEGKADHFAIVNNEKFHQVWNLNKDNCLEVLKKITETDKILYEQQMGIQWTPPIYHIMKMRNLQSYKDALQVTGEYSLSQSIVSTSSSVMGVVKDKRMEEAQRHFLAPKSTSLMDANPIYRRLLKYLLTHVSDKSGFLTEKRLKELLEPYEDDQKTLVRLDNVFESLGIYKKEDIDLLVSYFVPYTYCPVCSAQPDMGVQTSMITRFTSQMSNISAHSARKETDSAGCLELESAYNAVHQPAMVLDEVINALVPAEEVSEESEEKSSVSLDAPCNGTLATGEQLPGGIPKEKAAKRTVGEEKFLCEFNHPLLISSVYILRALREFVTNYYEEKEGLPTTGERLQRRRHTVARLLTETDMVRYWDRFKKVYDEDRIKIWDALFEGLKKYHEILKDRKMLCEEVVDLRKQNRDLKRLLSNYIDHGDIMPPPCPTDNEKFGEPGPIKYNRATKTKKMIDDDLTP